MMAREKKLMNILGKEQIEGESTGIKTTSNHLKKNAENCRNCKK